MAWEKPKRKGGRVFFLDSYHLDLRLMLDYDDFPFT